MTIIGHHQRKGPQLLRGVHRIARIRRQTSENFRPHLKKRVYIEPELTLPAQMWSSPRFHQSRLLWPRSCRWTKSFPFSFFLPSCGSWHARPSRHHCPWSQTWVGILSSAHQDYWTKNTIFLQLKVLREALSIWTLYPIQHYVIHEQPLMWIFQSFAFPDFPTKCGVTARSSLLGPAKASMLIIPEPIALSLVYPMPYSFHLTLSKNRM